MPVIDDLVGVGPAQALQRAQLEEEQRARQQADPLLAELSAMLDSLRFNAARIVRASTGVNTEERDERKRQRTWRFGTSGSRSITGARRQTFRRVLKHVKQWDGIPGYREKTSSAGWTRFDKYASHAPWYAQ
jgi:hypothetical protein